MPQCVPYLFYDDIDGALQFLSAAFGFREEFVHREDDGPALHARLRLGDGVVMLGPAGTAGALRPVKSPKSQGSVNASVYHFVDDADAHCEAARAAGAEIVMEPADMFWGDRIYCAVDSEDQFWTFATTTD